jgi:hypothetical protein
MIPPDLGLAIWHLGPVGHAFGHNRIRGALHCVFARRRVSECACNLGGSVDGPAVDERGYGLEQRAFGVVEQADAPLAVARTVCWRSGMSTVPVPGRRASQPAGA